MNLKELNYNKQKKLNQLMESRFGIKINYQSLSLPKAQKLQENICNHLVNLRKTYGTSQVEKNPKYMEMLVVRESLQNWIDNRRQLTEGELETAEVVLAAKDMVDSIQNMLEDASKMLNEQMPPLLDTIRDQLGPEQADAYKSSASAALRTLLDNLNSARDALDSGARSLAGEESAAMPMGPELGAGPELGDQDLEVDNIMKSDPAVGGDKPLGREKR